MAAEGQEEQRVASGFLGRFLGRVSCPIILEVQGAWARLHQDTAVLLAYTMQVSSKKCAVIFMLYAGRAKAQIQKSNLGGEESDVL